MDLVFAVGQYTLVSMALNSLRRAAGPRTCRGFRGMRLEGKVAIVAGAGQTPGDTIGNGRATAILFAREGARVLLVDRRLESAAETQQMIAPRAATAVAFEADITREDDCRAIAARCVEEFGRIDVLHNNVGIGGGDSGVTHLELRVLAADHRREPHRDVPHVQARPAGDARAGSGAI